MEMETNKSYITLQDFDSIKENYLNLKQVIIDLNKSPDKESSEAIKGAIYDLCSVASKQIDIMRVFLTSTYDASTVASYEGVLIREKGDLEQIKFAVGKTNNISGNDVYETHLPDHGESGYGGKN